MKTINILFATALLSLTMAGCSSTYYRSASYGDDDLYGTVNRIEVANRQKAEAEARKAEAEARQAEWDALMAENRYNDQNTNTFESVLADDYESAYARRLAGFNSPTYNMPSSYYNLKYSNKFFYVSAYDPAFYNLIVMGDQVWVEPKYITSMFGSWGTSSRFNIGFGWSTYNNWYSNWGYNPWYSPWWGWNSWYNPYYNPWWGGYDPWGHHHGGYYPRPYPSGPTNIVHRRPAYQGGSSYGRGDSGIVNRGDRPSYPSNYNRGNGTISNRGGSLSSGSNNGYRGSSNVNYNNRNNNGSSSYRNNNGSSSLRNDSSNSSYNRNNGSTNSNSGSGSFRGGSSSGSYGGGSSSGGSSSGGGGSRNSFGR